MKQSKFFSSSLLFVIIMTIPFGLQADDLIDQSSNIFKFQQKLANNGNVGAQYKLASMYESGDGVTASIEQAKHWYGRAADAGSKPAMHRNTYLITKEQGYDQVKNGAWLKSVKKDANARDADAMLLLGQLYGEGLGVKKDLVKSLELLEQVQMLGAANVDSQIAKIRSELAVIENNEQQSQEPAKVDVGQAEKDRLKIQQAKAKKDSYNEKVKRYEQVMEKLRKEQEKIDKQQAWATGEVGLAGADDEI